MAWPNRGARSDGRAAAGRAASPRAAAGDVPLIKSINAALNDLVGGLNNPVNQLLGQK
jgi:hypothetical protein